MSRRCTIAVPSRAAASSTTATAAIQYVSIRYTERLAEAGIEPSVGSVGDSYDNALAETINGLYKTEVIRRRGPLAHRCEAVEFATLEWVDWFNNRRLLEPSETCLAPKPKRATMRNPELLADGGQNSSATQPPLQTRGGSDQDPGSIGLGGGSVLAKVIDDARHRSPPCRLGSDR